MGAESDSLVKPIMGRTSEKKGRKGEGSNQFLAESVEVDYFDECSHKRNRVGGKEGAAIPPNDC